MDTLLRTSEQNRTLDRRKKEKRHHRMPRIVDGADLSSARTSITSGESSDEASLSNKSTECHGTASTKSSITGTAASSNESTTTGNTSMPDEPDTEALPLHEQGSRNIEEEFELALISRRNKRLLLSRLYEVSPKGALVTINLSRRGLDLTDAFLIQQAVIINRGLAALMLSYNNLGDEGCTTISKGILQEGVHHPNLSVLDLGFNEIGNSGCEALAVNVLAGNYVIKTLFLSGNVVGEKGVVSIAGAILHGTGLSRLGLSATDIGAVGVRSLLGAIEENNNRVASMAIEGGQLRGGISELDLGNTKLYGDGFIAVPGMLVTSTLLQSLSLSNNKLGDNEVALLAQALTQNKQVPLRDLILSFNEITCRGVEDLMNAIWGSTTLKQIKLDNNRILDRGAQLCAVVLTSVAVEVLDISCNQITANGIKPLMKTVSENTSLKSLGLCGINMDQNSSKAVSYAIAYNSSLERLYMDRCEAGYSAQRHIVAGIVSNRKSPLRLFTGFPIGPIASTLGIPRLPEEWSNDQVLGFLRMMWHQWLLKSGRGTVDKDIRGPAPHAAVAAASKVAFAALGTAAKNSFQTDADKKPVAERPPVDPANRSLLERSNSGTIHVPDFADTAEESLCEWAEAGSKSAFDATMSFKSRNQTEGSLVDRPEKRSKYLAWLRQHLWSLTSLSELPFNDADLWQLHQYYFSPPGPADEHEVAVNSPAELEETSNRAPPPTPSLQPAPSLDRAISFQSLGNALTASLESSHKRRQDEDPYSWDDRSAKRAKGTKQRIAFYPRLMSKIKSFGNRPMGEALTLLRQLQYVESVFFVGRDPYTCSGDQTSDSPSHADIEMILLDLL